MLLAGQPQQLSAFELGNAEPWKRSLRSLRSVGMTGRSDGSVGMTGGAK